MPKFNYQAITESGKSTKGSLEADSIDSRQQYFSLPRAYPHQGQRRTRGASALAQKSTSAGLFSTVKAPELILFTKQFKTLIRAGVPMITILQVLEDQTENPKLQENSGDHPPRHPRGGQSVRRFQSAPAGLFTALLQHAARR